MYPRYFRHTFHYQGDGWFSDESAKVYEASTETLFVGRQDAMQRHTLVPFSKFMQGATGRTLQEAVVLNDVRFNLVKRS